MRPLLIVFALSVFAFENQDIPNKEQQIAGAFRQYLKISVKAQESMDMIQKARS